MDKKTIDDKIIALAKTHPDTQTDTETYAYPIIDDVPKRFWKELGIGERKGRGQLKVLEIYFDTPQLNIQEYATTTFDDGEEDGEIWSYDLQDLPKDFAEWVVDNLISTIKREK